MSKEAAIQLIKVAENDPTLLEQLKCAKEPETVLEIARAKGYEFTHEELIEVMQEKQLSFTSDELSEEQLEAVVGGKQKVEVKEGAYVTYNEKTKD